MSNMSKLFFIQISRKLVLECQNLCNKHSNVGFLWKKTWVQTKKISFRKASNHKQTSISNDMRTVYKNWEISKEMKAKSSQGENRRQDKGRKSVFSEFGTNNRPTTTWTSWRRSGSDYWCTECKLVKSLSKLVLVLCLTDDLSTIPVLSLGDEFAFFEG